VLGAKSNVGASAIVLAAYGAALRELSRADTVAVQLTSGNRRSPLLKRSIGNFAQNSLVILRAAPAGPQMIEEAWEECRSAYAHSCFDWNALRVLREQVLSARALAQVDDRIFFNDRRRPGSLLLAGAKGHDLEALQPSSSFAWLDAPPTEHVLISMTVDESEAGMTLTSIVDTRVISKEVAQTLLSGVERYLIGWAGTAGEVADSDHDGSVRAHLVGDQVPVAVLTPNATRPPGWLHEDSR
jgi:hypothetical protein